MKPLAREEVNKLFGERSPEEIKRYVELLDIARKAASKKGVITKAEVAELEELRTQFPTVNDIAHEAYMRHAGEVEARNVQARALVDKPEVSPWRSEDRPRDKQIVVKR